jgi:hypothetical protein
MAKTQLLMASVLIVTGLVAGCREAPSPAPVRPVKAVRVGDLSDLGGKRWFPA